MLGAPEVLASAAALPPDVHGAIEQRARERRRVLLFAECREPLHEAGEGDDPTPPPLRALALAVLSEQLRPSTDATVAFLADAGVTVKVISGDGPLTVEAVARAAGIPTEGRVTTGRAARGRRRARRGRRRQRRLRARAAGAEAAADRGAPPARPATSR